MESLRHYIEEAGNTGASHEEVKTRLLAHGWDEQAIDEALAHYQGSGHLDNHAQQHEKRYLEPSDHIHITYAPTKNRIAAAMLDIFITLPLISIILFFTITEGSDGTTVSIPIWIVSVWFYFAIFESSHFQATLGKRLLGIYVARSSGEVASFRQTSVRFFAKLLSVLPLGTGIIAANSKHQMFHDRLADTVVVVREPVENPAQVAKYTKLGLGSFFVLVILPIVGILTAFIFNLARPAPVPPSSNSPVVTGAASAQARDASRKTDINSYATALTTYNSAHHSYPVSHDDSSFPASGIFSANGALNGLASGFPTDPKNGQLLCQPTTTSPHVTCSYHYFTNSTGTSYILWAELELPGSGGGVYYIDSNANSGLLTSDPTSAP